MKSNEKLDLDTSKVESKDKWQMFDILNVKRPTIAKLKESLTLAKAAVANLEGFYVSEQLTNKAHKEHIDSLQKQLRKAHDKSEEVYSANIQLLENCKALKLTISDLEGRLAAKKAVKSYPLIAVVIIAVIESLIIFCLV